MARSNLTSGEQRIAAELLLKIGLRVSSRIVRGHMGGRIGGGGRGATEQQWAAFAFVHDHGRTVLACDICVAVTATFRVLYVFVALEVGSRRLLHVNVTDYPIATWTLQQFREVLAAPHAFRFALHDRDSIYSPWLDAAVAAMDVRVLRRTPIQAPRANAFCERLLGSLRRECLDFLIPFRSGRTISGGFFACGGRTTIAAARTRVSARDSQSLVPRYQWPDHWPSAPAGRPVVARSVLGGLHHEYGIEKRAT